MSVAKAKFLVTIIVRYLLQDDDETIRHDTAKAVCLQLGTDATQSSLRTARLLIDYIIEEATLNQAPIKAIFTDIIAEQFSLMEPSSGKGMFDREKDNLFKDEPWFDLTLAHDAINKLS
jgi:hypothetical protein